MHRSTSDAGLSLLPDAGAPGAPGSSIPGLEGLGIDPDQLGTDGLPPGFADAGLIPPDFGLGTPTPGGPGSLFPGSPTPSGGTGGLVGKPCASNGDCGAAPAFCIPAGSNAEFGSGGPQGGFCSLPCAGNAECFAADGQSACNVQLGFCLGVCTPGANGPKCDLDRPLACVPEADTTGVCLPTCTSNAACGAGRFCDLAATGTCQDTPPSGGPVGSPCERETESSDCAGDICLTFRDPLDGVTPVGSFCSANCTFGRTDGCGFDTLSSGTRGAACLQLQDADGARGDLGFCVELCDDSSDCAQSTDGWVCEPFTDPSVVAALGRAGRCLPVEVTSDPGFPDLPDDEGLPGLPDLPGFSDLISR